MGVSPADATEGVYFCEKSHCSHPQFLAQSGLGGDITSDGVNIYWDWQDVSGTHISTCPATGCSEATSVVSWSSNVWASGLTTDGTNLYWLEGTTLNACSVGGCAAPSVLMTTPSGFTLLPPVVSDGTRVYFTNSGAIDEIDTCSVNGCVTPEPLLGSQPSPCAACLESIATAETCSSAGMTCDNNASCTALYDCIGACTTEACVNGCVTANESGLADYEAIGTCACGPSVCGPACGAGCTTVSDGFATTDAGLPDANPGYPAQVMGGDGEHLFANVGGDGVPGAQGLAACPFTSCTGPASFVTLTAPGGPRGVGAPYRPPTPGGGGATSGSSFGSDAVEHGLASDGVTVFWMNETATGQAIDGCSIAGCVPATILQSVNGSTSPENAFWYEGFDWLVVDTTDLYWVGDNPGGHTNGGSVVYTLAKKTREAIDAGF